MVDTKIIFLKLLVAGHLTLYVVRNTGWIWDRPWPSWKLLVATETTQILGTLAAVYGWWVTPIGWEYALWIWAYALAWIPIENLAKVASFHILRNGPPWHSRYTARVHRRIS